MAQRLYDKALSRFTALKGKSQEMAHWFTIVKQNQQVWIKGLNEI